jgi:hypothetical protein
VVESLSKRQPAAILKRNKLRGYRCGLDNGEHQLPVQAITPLPAWPLRRLTIYRPRGAVPLSVVLRSFLDWVPWFGRPSTPLALPDLWHRQPLRTLVSQAQIPTIDVTRRPHSGGRSSL